LLSGRIDFIVGALRNAPGEAFSARALFEDKAALVARAGHPLAQKKELCFADLEGYSWVLSRQGVPLRESLGQFFRKNGVAPPTPTVETGDLALLRGLLMGSDMLTVLSAHQLHYEVAASALVVLPFDMPGLERSIGVMTRKGTQLAPGARALLDEMEAVSARWDRAPA
jgi:LysR family transcriptional regulator of gallate degradation